MFQSISKYLVSSLIILLLTTSCATFSNSIHENMTGPFGVIKEMKSPKLYFEMPPREFYQLEKSAGLIFQHTQNDAWLEAENELTILRKNWIDISNIPSVKSRLPKSPEEKLSLLSNSIQEKDVAKTFENLNQFMGSIIDISKMYQLSPLTDIIALGNSLRNVRFYANKKDWSNLSKKSKELSNIWNNAKPGLEQIGIIGESTKIHSTITRLKDGIESENISQVNDELQKLNTSLALLRTYYSVK